MQRMWIKNAVPFGVEIYTPDEREADFICQLVLDNNGAFWRKDKICKCRFRKQSEFLNFLQSFLKSMRYVR